MKKLLVTLALAGTLSVPSVVFAEANWYGSLRIGVQSSDSTISIADGASRWGIKGSAEAGEGLTAVYRFEQGINAATATQSPGRLSYVGLSGGFGTLTMGQVWSASFNTVGSILDKAWYYGNAGTSFRLGNAISYAFSNDLMTLQIDAVYGAPEELVLKATSANPPVTEASTMTDNLQQVEFGLSVNAGDIGKVAFAYVDDDHAGVTDANKLANAAGTPVAFKSSWGTKKTIFAGEVNVAGVAIYAGTGSVKYKNTSPKFEVDAQGAATNTPFTGSTAVKPTVKSTFLGVSGGLGDTGVSYVLQWSETKDTKVATVSGTPKRVADKSSPWVISLTKSLGDSASLVFEHGNDGKKPKATKSTQLGMVVNF